MPTHKTTRQPFDDQAADHNASQIRDALFELNNRINPTFSSPHFKSCWEQVKTVRSLLGELRPIRKAERDKFYADLNSHCETLKHKQDEYYLERNTRSSTARGYVLNDIRSAGFAVQGATDIDGLREADQKFQEIREQLASRDSGSLGSQMTKEARDECWRAFNDAREAAQFRWRHLHDLDYSELGGPVADVAADAGRDRPGEVKARIKELQRRVSAAFLSKLQRDELRGRLQSAWDTADARAAEGRSNAREKAEAAESMFEEILERKRDAIRRLEENIDKLRSQDIWSDDYAARVDEWIEESQDNISRIEQEVKDVEKKLESVRERLANFR